MLPLLASLVLPSPGFQPPTQDSRTVLLAAAMVRHQEPVKKGGVRVTVAEIYPIAWETRGEYLDASVDSTDSKANSALRPGDRFEIYQNGWNVGWFDINRVASKPYVSSNKVVGLGGWSLPRRLYPYRLDKATNLNYLYRSVYDWGNDTYKNSVQPFLALNTERKSISSTEFSPGQLKRDITPVVQDNMKRILKQVDPSLKMSDIHLRTLKAFDLDDDRVPDVVAVYDLPRKVRYPPKTLMVVATVEAGAFIERYRALNQGMIWQPFDVIDVDGDNYNEIVLLGKDIRMVSFQVLHGTGGKMQKVFEGASFGYPVRY